MSELLLRSITEKVPLTEAEQQQCLGYFTPQKLHKKQVLLLPGDVCNQLAFVEKGALYSYSTDAKSNAHVLQFAFEGYWIADLYSFFTQEPSKLTIEALEPSEILVLTGKSISNYSTICRLTKPIAVFYTRMPMWPCNAVWKAL